MGVGLGKHLINRRDTEFTFFLTFYVVKMVYYQEWSPKPLQYLLYHIFSTNRVTDRVTSGNCL